MTPEELAHYANDRSMSTRLSINIDVFNADLTPEKRAAITNMVGRFAKGLALQFSMLAGNNGSITVQRYSSQMGTTEIDVSTGVED